VQLAFFSQTETPAASHRADCDQPGRNAIALVTAPGTRLPRQSPPSPPRSSAAVAVPRSKPHATETVPVNWQITWHTNPLPRPWSSLESRPPIP